MHLTYRNVNQAFNGLIQRIADGDIPTTKSDSRNGSVIRVNGPVIVTFEKPRERVLFNPIRDCNPFFHLFESLWMLAGSNDVRALSYYNSNIQNYSDDGKTFHGAYGHRWRTGLGFDQISGIVDVLRENKNDRRAVLQMWDSSNRHSIEEFGKLTDEQQEERNEYGFNDLETGYRGGKDIPCNLSAVFEILDNKLNMTVFNRSNDLIWGMLGANVFHFSFLQEFIADMLKVDLGVYHQITNNLHIYTEKDKGLEYLTPTKIYSDPSRDLYISDKTGIYLRPICVNSSYLSFLDECTRFVNTDHWRMHQNWDSKFLREVAAPMCLAYLAYKRKVFPTAFEHLYKLPDWCDLKYVGVTWMEKRRLSHERKQTGYTDE